MSTVKKSKSKKGKGKLRQFLSNRSINMLLPYIAKGTTPPTVGGPMAKYMYVDGKRYVVDRDFIKIDRANSNKPYKRLFHETAAESLQARDERLADEEAERLARERAAEEFFNPVTRPEELLAPHLVEAIEQVMLEEDRAGVDAAADSRLKMEVSHVDEMIFDRKDSAMSESAASPPVTKVDSDVEPAADPTVEPSNPVNYTRPWPDPTAEDLQSPLFNVIWDVIKNWDISVPDAYFGYCGATGNHAKAIAEAVMGLFWFRHDAQHTLPLPGTITPAKSE